MGARRDRSPGGPVGASRRAHTREPRPNSDFLDVLAQASEDAAKTGQREKLESLRNAVLNAALPSDIDADQQAIFLRHISDFTPSHLRLLSLLSDPPAWFAGHGLTWPDGLNSESLRTIVE